MSNNPPSENTNQIDTAPELVSNTYVRKTMNYYQVTKRDIQHVSAVNTVATVCISIATLFIGLLESCAWGILQQTNAPSTGEIAYIAACTVFAIAAAAVGTFFLLHRNREIKEILGEPIETELPISQSRSGK